MTHSTISKIWIIRGQQQTDFTDSTRSGLPKLKGTYSNMDFDESKDCIKQKQ
jgi:hypothetical protein